MDLAQLFKTNFSEWYQQVIFDAELVDNSPTRGSFVIRPNGYAMWETIQREFDKVLKKKKIQNAYFPLFIPEAFLKKEADHIEGFAPELAVVTHAGGKELEEPYVVRPTSETIIYHMFSKWIKSYRDLPLKINQWANVVRWEMRPRAFLRTTEFLWQEGHTAHATREEAEALMLEMITAYHDLARDLLAIPLIVGEKTPTERFAGGEITMTIEGLMQDGKALQMGTSHLLQNSFPASFDVAFQAEDGTHKAPWCTSWGITTRFIGGIVMIHGDERGLVLPPRVAQYQVVIVPIGAKDDFKVAVAKAHEIAAQLENAGVRVFVDDAENQRPGAKFFHWEVRGIPVRIELGKRDIDAGVATVVSRVAAKETAKQTINLGNLIAHIPPMLDQIHDQMYANAVARRQAAWHHAETFAAIEQNINQKPGFYQVGWCGDAVCEKSLKQIQCTPRCILKDTHTKSACFNCSKPSKTDILVAKAY